MTDTLFDIGIDQQTVRAAVTRVNYHERGFTIAKATVDPANPLIVGDGQRVRVITCKGNMVEPQVGQLYEFSGKVEFDPKWASWQIEFDSYRTILPTDRDGIASYLIDVARWVGPSTAKALLDAFGDRTLEVLKHEPHRASALDVPGLTADRVAEMSDSLQKNERLEAATIEVNNLLAGVLGPATVRKAVKKWGCDAGTRIKGNPFELIALHGVGFINADAVHKKLGGDPQALNRHTAAVCHILSEAAGREGHTLLPLSRVQMEGQRLVGGLRPEVFDLCEAEDLAGSDGITVSLAELSKSERYVANKILAMLSSSAGSGTAGRVPPEIDTDGLAEDQVAAVQAFRWASVFCLVGAPGTGKTYTLARIVRTLEGAGLTVRLAAPTGKAAKQMTLALAATCGGTAVTIHSLLEPTVDDETGEFSFGRNEGNPLDCDVLVLDELSMVDCRLMRSVLRAVRDTTRLLLVGDPYQLPSVGPGAVLRDLFRAGVPAFELKRIKRNAGDIVRACHAIKDGHSPACFATSKLDLQAGHNWRHIEVAGPAEIKGVIERLVRDLLPKLGLDMHWDAQVISPTNETGDLSCDALNALLRPILNPAHKPEGKLPFSVGDKVLRTKNQNVPGEYTGGEAETEGVPAGENNPANAGGQIRIVNGDVGLVREIDSKTVTVDFKYPDRRACIKRAEHELKLAYCMTCHKLQGSECQVVILPVHRSFARMPMVTREWIYTAMSRAKRFLLTVGGLDAVDSVVPKIGMNARQTTLHRLLAPGLRREVVDL